MDEIDQMLHFVWELIKIVASSIIEAIKISIGAIGKALPLMMNVYKKK